MDGRIAAITIYPVKGMRGIDLDSSEVEPRGLANDRRYLVVDSEGVFLSQRCHPILATIQPTVVPGGIQLTKEGHDPNTATPGTARRSVTVWRSTVEAVDCGDATAQWLSAVLSSEVRLVFMDQAAVRPVNLDFGQAGDEVSFADGFPLLLTTLASLADLNARMGEDLPMNRFRPNLVVEGVGPWWEDTATLVEVGSVPFRNVKPCGRCLVTTTDQRTGERMGEEPLRTLASFRKVDGNVMFGVNLIPDAVGTISVGDSVTALRVADPVP